MAVAEGVGSLIDEAAGRGRQHLSALHPYGRKRRGQELSLEYSEPEFAIWFCHFQAGRPRVADPLPEPRDSYPVKRA